MTRIFVVEDDRDIADLVSPAALKRRTVTHAA